MTFYRLDDATGEPVACANIEEWARWRAEHDDAQQLVDDTIDDVRVSTVFLGLDHGGPWHDAPVLWETIIFGGPNNQAQWRYTSKADALANHARIVELLKQDYRGEL